MQLPTVDPRARARQQALANPAFTERMWKPGQSGNPAGRSGLFLEMQRRAREATPELIGYLLEIARDGSEDARNRIVAIQIMLERGWGKVQAEYDPAQEKVPMVVDPSRLTPEQRESIVAALALLKSVAVQPQPIPDAANGEVEEAAASAAEPG